MVTPGTDAMPVVNIVGERVALGPLRREDVALHHRWHNDSAIRRTLGEPRPRTLERELAAYERDARAKGDAHLTISDRATWRPIGTTHLFGLDFRNGAGGVRHPHRGGSLSGGRLRDRDDPAHARLRLHRTGVAQRRPDGERL